MKPRHGLLIAVAVISLAACASRPEETKEVELTAKNAVYLQRLGYKIVNQDGKTLICARNATTGTMIQKTTTCLTEEQWAQVLHGAQYRPPRTRRTEISAGRV